MLLLLVLACGGEPDDTDRPPRDTASHDLDGDGVTDDGDCAPEDPLASPDAVERCNGVDDNCDGTVDEGFDGDGDGWLTDSADCRALGAPTDCDDADDAVHPEAEELCNRRDDDCDGLVDDAPDADGDGWAACDDCDDADRFANPGEPDACDGSDNDCDGVVDEGFDADGDGASACAGDCDDSDPTRGPTMAELCDGIDTDCDGDPDNGYDLDGDGSRTCDDDCDEADPTTYPGAPELCDGRDNDCDPATDEVADLDGDGYTLCTGDCNDGSAAALPGGTEVCDSVDNDCDGRTDDLPECYGCTEQAPYLYCTSAVDWPTAEAACVNFGGHLAAIADDAEDQRIATQLRTYTRASAWVGATDADVEGTFVWTDGTAVAYTAWSSGQPDNSGNEDCVGINYSGLGLWNDYPCMGSWYLAFVCER